MKAHSVSLGLSQSAGGPAKDYTLSWSEATKSTDTSKTTYHVFMEFGLDAVGYDTVSPATHPNYVTSVLEQTSVIISGDVGTRGFKVVSEDSFDGANEISNTVYHNFIHVGQGNSGGPILFTRTDGDNTHRGVKQVWKFGYEMDEDAYVTMRVYPPGTQFLRDANQFVTGPAGGVTPTKTLLELTPRSGELSGGSIPGSSTDGGDQWDSRDSSGAIVSNGIYYVLIQARLDPGQFAYPEGELRYGSYITIPVDILRILDLEATGITISNPTSLITYTLTGDANVRIVIARPGAGFTVDSSGDIQPFNLTTGLIDTNLIVSTKTFQRKAGENVESWDGTTSTGAAVTWTV